MPKQVSDVVKLNFYSGCQTFCTSTLRKLAERSPLKYPLVRGLSALKPATMATSSTVAIKRFKVCLTKLVSANRITSTEADQAEAQFSRFIRAHLLQLQSLSESDGRLDQFFYSLIGELEEYRALWKTIKVYSFYIFVCALLFALSFSDIACVGSW